MTFTCLKKYVKQINKPLMMDVPTVNMFDTRQCFSSMSFGILLRVMVKI